MLRQAAALSLADKYGCDKGSIKNEVSDSAAAGTLQITFIHNDFLSWI
jgi:hypothetical protein